METSVSARPIKGFRTCPLQIQIESAAGNTKRETLKKIHEEIESATDPVAKTCAIAELHDIALSYEGYIENLAEYIAKLEAKLEAK